MIFQDVVHSIGTREADCDEQSSFRGETEWTSTRMPDLPFAVERPWLSMHDGADVKRLRQLQRNSENRRQVGAPLPRGKPGLWDRSSRPHRSPRRTSSVADAGHRPPRSCIPPIRSPKPPASVPPPSAAFCNALISTAGAICIPLRRWCATNIPLPAICSISTSRA